MPSQREMEIPLLHLIYMLDGEVHPSDTFGFLTDYFRISDVVGYQQVI